MFVLSISLIEDGRSDSSAIIHGLSTHVVQSYEQCIHTCCSVLYNGIRHYDDTDLKRSNYYRNLVEDLRILGSKPVTKENRCLVNILNTETNELEYYMLHEIVSLDVFLEYCRLRFERDVIIDQFIADLHQDRETPIPSVLPIDFDEARIIRVFDNIFNAIEIDLSNCHPLIPQNMFNDGLPAIEHRDLECNPDRLIEGLTLQK